MNSLESLKNLLHVDAAIKSDRFAYARARQFMRYKGDWLVYIYHLNEKSPTGVILAAGGWDKDVAPILKKYGRTSPISPTEMR